MTIVSYSRNQKPKIPRAVSVNVKMQVGGVSDRPIFKKKKKKIFKPIRRGKTDKKYLFSVIV